MIKRYEANVSPCSTPATISKYSVYGTSLKLVDKFPYLGSSVPLTEKDIDTQLTKAWTAIDKLSIIWKSDLTDKNETQFLPSSGRVDTAVVSILLYGNKTAGEEARRQLHKNVASNIE